MSEDSDLRSTSLPIVRQGDEKMSKLLNAIKAPFDAEAAKTSSFGEVAAVYGLGAILITVIIRG